jgi:arylsulfatase A-like enzyme/Tfp pilus assembly protein PilF
MTGRRIVGALACAALLAISFGLWRWVSAPSVNVLLITLDTTRADRLGCYGYAEALTPTLDRLASEGVLFEQAGTPAPLTLPSHASMMTGLLPPEHGLTTNGRGRLDDDIPTLAATLSDAGYDTGGFVASFVLHRKFGLDRGFAAYDDDLTNTEPSEHGLQRQRDGRRVVDSALEWLGLSRSKPFFCWVHLYDPHHPYQHHPSEFGETFRDRPYDGEIAYVDQQVKRLLDFLDAHGSRENTLVVVAGDHGEGMGEHEEFEHGLTLYENVLHVPWIWSGPGVASKGKRVPQPVSLVDLRPTLLATLGLRDAARVTGRSLQAAFTGGNVEPGQCYAGTDNPLLERGWHPLRSLTTERWKYIRTPDVELYDLSADAQEKRNLAAEQPAQVQALEHELSALEKEMIRREGVAVTLTPQEQRALASLGYLSGQVAGETPASGEVESLPDVKRMLPLDNALGDARRLLHHGDAAGSEKALRKLIADAPRFLPARQTLIEVLSVQQKFDEAQAAAAEVLKDHPDDSETHFQLGIIHSRHGKFEEGIAEFRKSLVEKPNSVGTLVNLGRSLAAVGQADEAERSFREAIEEDSLYVTAHVQLGMLLAAQKRLDEAEQCYREALRYSPDLIEAHANLAILLVRIQKLDEAGNHFARAAALAPENAETRFNFGTFLLGQGRIEDAIRELEAALKANPQHARAKARLEQARAARIR